AGAHVSQAQADATDLVPAAGERPRLPAQLPAPELARLPVLGHGARPRLSPRPPAAACARGRSLSRCVRRWTTLGPGAATAAGRRPPADAVRGAPARRTRGAG